MTEAERFDLLKDLARLIKKYGAETFSDLAVFLKDPNAITELVTILEAGAIVGRKASSSERRSSPKHSKVEVEQLLSDLESKDPEKTKAMLEFYYALLSKRIFASLRELRSFAEDNGLTPLKANSREKAIAPIIGELVSRPTGEVLKILSRVSIQDISGDRTLGGWTDIILKKKESGL